MKKKILVACLCVALAVLTIAGTTLAYLTSRDEVVNTFTVGNVSITLDEAAVDDLGNKIVNEDGTPVDRVDANNYKLIPGHTYNKDPMVTVLKGSESSYIKMTVTFSKSAELDAIFAPNGADMTSIFKGYDSTNWIAKGNTKDATADTRTYEFWYKEAVAAPNGDVALDALFDQIQVPGTITNDQLKTIEDMTITVNAYAIQADGFTDAADAWSKFPTT